MSPLQRQLVAQLRTAYYESGLTYDHIAARAEMSRDTVCSALNDGRVNVSTLLRLCYVLGREVRLTPASYQ